MILYVGVGIFLVAYAFFWKIYLDVNDSADKVFNDVETNNKRDEAVTIEATHPISFAFLGIDNGAFGREDAGRSDAVIVGTVNPKTKTTTLVSLPRDSYTLMDGYEMWDDSPFYDKLTHAYAFGGAKMSINSIQEFLNIPIDYYVEINMQGLVDIVDALGGIEVESPLTFDYMEHYFTKGETRLLNGNESLAFSRMRKTDPDGDFGRQEREKLVIKAILDKVLSLDSVVNYQSILYTLEENVKTNLSYKDMKKMLSSYSKSLDNFEQDNLLGDELWLNDIYYLYVPPENRLELSNKLRRELEISEIEVEDLNLSDYDYSYIDYSDIDDWNDEYEDNDTEDTYEDEFY